MQLMRADLIYDILSLTPSVVSVADVAVALALWEASYTQGSARPELVPRMEPSAFAHSRDHNAAIRGDPAQAAMQADPLRRYSCCHVTCSFVCGHPRQSVYSMFTRSETCSCSCRLRSVLRFV